MMYQSSAKFTSPVKASVTLPSWAGSMRVPVGGQGRGLRGGFRRGGGDGGWLDSGSRRGGQRRPRRTAGGQGGQQGGGEQRGDPERFHWEPPFSDKILLSPYHSGPVFATAADGLHTATKVYPQFTNTLPRRGVDKSPVSGIIESVTCDAAPVRAAARRKKGKQHDLHCRGRREHPGTGAVRPANQRFRGPGLCGRQNFLERSAQPPAGSGDSGCDAAG